VESGLMRIPLPVFYLAEDEDGRMVVVDGLQRLSTFQRFMNNELQLKLPDQATLNKLRFRDLSPKLQNRIEDCNLILYIIDAKVPERARLDIFERVNGGVPLTRQQMRNCLFMGNATQFLKAEASSDSFLKATGHSLASLTMRDREFVNRFCAFQLLLARALKKMNNLDLDALDKLSAQFRTSLVNNFTVFGKHAFRKQSEGKDSRSVLNASLWDVMSTGLTHYPEHVVEARADDLRTAFYALMVDEGFVKAVTYGTNDANRVKHRFAVAGAMLKEVFGDHSA